MNESYATLDSFFQLVFIRQTGFLFLFLTGARQHDKQIAVICLLLTTTTKMFIGRIYCHWFVFESMNLKDMQISLMDKMHDKSCRTSTHSNFISIVRHSVTFDLGRNFASSLASSSISRVPINIFPIICEQFQWEMWISFRVILLFNFHKLVVIHTANWKFSKMVDVFYILNSLHDKEKG